MNVYDHLRGFINPQNDHELPLGLIGELVEHCNGIAEFRVQIPVQAFLATVYSKQY